MIMIKMVHYINMKGTAAATAGQSITHGLLVVLILAVVAVGLLVVYYHRNAAAVQTSISFFK